VRKGDWLAIWAPLAIGAGFTSVCYGVAGNTLGVFVGGIVGLTLIVPGAVAGEKNWWGRAWAVEGAVMGVGIIWSILAMRGVLSASEYLACVVVLAAHGIALAGLAVMLKAVKLPGACASAIVIALALGWLSWPIWMAPHQHGEEHSASVGWLMRTHPVFAINQALTRPMPGIWQEQKIMYQLVSIGQHVSANMPETIWWCVGGLVVVGAAGGGLGWRIEDRGWRMEDGRGGAG
jgi:hypothetical protein